MSLPGRGAPWLLAIAALALALGACEDATNQGRGEPQRPAAGRVPRSDAPDRTLPTPTEGANAADTAKASDPPMKQMSKEEEANSMPLPGQANDHSTLAKEPAR